MSDTVINIEQLEEIRDILGDAVKDVIIAFIKDTQKIINDIVTAYEQNDNEQIAWSSHTLKSSSFQVGAESVRQGAISLEKLVRYNEESPNKEDIKGYIDKLQTSLDAYKTQINDYL